MAFRTCFFVAPGDRFSRISRAYSLKKYQVNIRVQRARLWVTPERGCFAQNSIS